MSRLKYTILLGGGAVRGLAYIGALRALEELDVEYDIIGGSSVGAVFAALIASGYKSYELENIFMKVNFELFKDVHLGFGKPFAISKGGIFVDWLNELISKGRDCENKVKFDDMERNLVVITTNLTKFTTQEFSKLRTPDFDVAEAVRISSSMPGLMPPYNYNGNDLVDGDLQKAAPMWKLTSTLSNSESRILEFRLEGDCAANSINPISFINTIYSCVTQIATNFVTEIYGNNDRYDYITLNTGDIFFADFSLDKEARRKLIESGYEQTMDYFKNKLPTKKEKISVLYNQILKCLKSIEKGVKSNDVEEVKWWLGDLFILLCENKEVVSPDIYNEIVDLREGLMNSVSRFFLIYSRFDNKDELLKRTGSIINKLKQTIAELRLFLQKCK